MYISLCKIESDWRKFCTKKTHHNFTSFTWLGTATSYWLYKKVGFWSSESITLTYNVVVDDRGGLPWSCKKTSFSIIKLSLQKYEKYNIIVNKYNAQFNDIGVGKTLSIFYYWRTAHRAWEIDGESTVPLEFFTIIAHSVLRDDTHRSSESIYSNPLRSIYRYLANAKLRYRSVIEISTVVNRTRRAIPGYYQFHCAGSRS